MRWDAFTPSTSDTLSWSKVFFGLSHTGRERSGLDPSETTSPLGYSCLSMSWDRTGRQEYSPDSAYGGNASLEPKTTINPDLYPKKRNLEKPRLPRRLSRERERKPESAAATRFHPSSAPKHGTASHEWWPAKNDPHCTNSMGPWDQAGQDRRASTIWPYGHMDAATGRGERAKGKGERHVHRTLPKTKSLSFFSSPTLCIFKFAKRSILWTRREKGGANPLFSHPSPYKSRAFQRTIAIM